MAESVTWLSTIFSESLEHKYLANSWVEFGNKVMIIGLMTLTLYAISQTNSQITKSCYKTSKENITDNDNKLLEGIGTLSLSKMENDLTINTKSNWTSAETYGRKRAIIYREIKHISLTLIICTGLILTPFTYRRTIQSKALGSLKYVRDHFDKIDFNHNARNRRTKHIESTTRAHMDDGESTEMDTLGRDTITETNTEYNEMTTAIANFMYIKMSELISFHKKQIVSEIGSLGAIITTITILTMTFGSKFLYWGFMKVGYILQRNMKVINNTSVDYPNDILFPKITEVTATVLYEETMKSIHGICTIPSNSVNAEIAFAIYFILLIGLIPTTIVVGVTILKLIIFRDWKNKRFHVNKFTSNLKNILDTRICEEIKLKLDQLLEKSSIELEQGEINSTGPTLRKLLRKPSESDSEENSKSSGVTKADTHAPLSMVHGAETREDLAINPEDHLISVEST